MNGANWLPGIVVLAIGRAAALVGRDRRRRSNRPGNSQAKGRQADGTLESDDLPNEEEHVHRRSSHGTTQRRERSLRSPDRGAMQLMYRPFVPEN